MRRVIQICCALALVAFLYKPAAVAAKDSYYMILFAHETKPGPITNSHTYATFVKSSDEQKQAAAIHTISWMPANLNVRLLKRPETGANLNLEESLRLAESSGARIVAWGPYEIDKELYQRALAQIERLKSGNIAYKATDRGLRPDQATNCFHAISDIVDGPLLNTGLATGVRATEMVRDHLQPWIQDGTARPKWLIDALKLNKHTIDYAK